jgi:hypothetical protein
MKFESVCIPPVSIALIASKAGLGVSRLVVSIVSDMLLIRIPQYFTQCFPTPPTHSLRHTTPPSSYNDSPLLPLTLSDIPLLPRPTTIPHSSSLLDPHSVPRRCVVLVDWYCRCALMKDKGRCNRDPFSWNRKAEVARAKRARRQQKSSAQL